MTYRDDLHALRARHLWLQQELAHIDASAGALKDRRAAVTEEIEATRLRIAGHPPVRAASPLDAIRVASPCKADWNSMTGDDRVRFCGTCAKNVYNLSAMSRGEAERLLYETEGRVCTRFFKRADGTVLTQDCPVGAERKAVRRLALVSAGSAALVAASVAARAAMLAPASVESQEARPRVDEIPPVEVTRVVALREPHPNAVREVPSSTFPKRGHWVVGDPALPPLDDRYLPVICRVGEPPLNRW